MKELRDMIEEFRIKMPIDKKGKIRIYVFLCFLVLFLLWIFLCFFYKDYLLLGIKFIDISIWVLLIYIIIFIIDYQSWEVSTEKKAMELHRVFKKLNKFYKQITVNSYYYKFEKNWRKIFDLVPLVKFIRIDVPTKNNAGIEYLKDNDSVSKKDAGDNFWYFYINDVNEGNFNEVVLPILEKLYKESNINKN